MLLLFCYFHWQSGLLLFSYFHFSLIFCCHSLIFFITIHFLIFLKLLLLSCSLLIILLFSLEFSCYIHIRNILFPFPRPGNIQVAAAFLSNHPHEALKPRQVFSLPAPLNYHLTRTTRSSYRWWGRNPSLPHKYFPPFPSSCHLYLPPHAFTFPSDHPTSFSPSLPYPL